MLLDTVEGGHQPRKPGNVWLNVIRGNGKKWKKWWKMYSSSWYVTTCNVIDTK